MALTRKEIERLAMEINDTSHYGECYYGKDAMGRFIDEIETLKQACVEYLAEMEDGE